MAKTALLAVAVVAVVAVAGVAVYFTMFNGGDDPGSDAPKYEVGDFYVTETVSVGSDGEEYRTQTTYTVTAVSDDREAPYQIKQESSGYSDVYWMSDILRMPDDRWLEDYGMEKAGSDILETPFGTFECDIWTMTNTDDKRTYSAEYWFSKEGRLNLFTKSTSTYDGSTSTYTSSVIETSIIGDTPPKTVTDVPAVPEYSMSDEPAVIAEKDTIVVGDYYVVADEVSYGGIVQKSYTTYKVIEVTDGDPQYRYHVWVGYYGGSESAGYTTYMDSFSLREDLERMTYVRTESIDTPFGNVECDVWTSDHEEDDYTETATMWVSKDGGIMLHAEAVTDHGDVSQNFSRTIVETNMLVTTSGGGEPDVPDTPGQDSQGYEVGDFVTLEYEFKDSSGGMDESSEITYTLISVQDGAECPYQMLEEWSDGSDGGVYRTSSFFIGLTSETMRGYGYVRSGTGTAETAFDTFPYDIWTKETYEGGTRSSTVWWVSQSEGLLLYESYKDRFSDGDSWEYSYTMTATSLVGDTPPRADAPTYASPEYEISQEPATLVPKEGTDPGDYKVYLTVARGQFSAQQYYQMEKVVGMSGDAAYPYEVWRGCYELQDDVVTGTRADFSLAYNTSGMTVVGAETIDTPFGRVECDVYEQSGDGWTTKVWISTDGDVMLRIEMVYSDGRSHCQTLIETNMLVTTPGGGEPYVPDTPAVPDTPDTPTDPDTPGDSPYRDEVRTDLRAGDYIWQRLYFPGVGYLNYSTTALSVSGDSVEVYYVGDSELQDTWTRSEFLQSFTPDIGSAIAGATMQGTQTIPTIAGDVLCERWYANNEEGVGYMYVSVETGVLYYMRVVTPQGVMEAFLTGSSLLASDSYPDAPIIPDTPDVPDIPAVPDTPTDPDQPAAGYRDVLRTDLRVGDYVVMGLTMPVMDAYDVPVTYTVVSIDGSELTVDYSEGEYKSQSTQSKEEFLNTLRPDPTMLSGFTLAGQETLDTIAGSVLCNIYEYQDPAYGITMWVSASSGVVYKLGGTEADMVGTYVLKDTSLLEKA